MAYGVSEGKPVNARIQLRGEPDKPGEEVPRRFLTDPGWRPGPVCGDGQRTPRTGRLAHPSVQSPDGTSLREPRLDLAFRSGSRRDAERLRTARRGPEPSELARLARDGIHPLGLVGESPAPPHPEFANLPGLERRRCGRGTSPSIRGTACLWRFVEATARCRGNPRRHARGERTSRPFHSRTASASPRSRPGPSRSTGPSTRSTIPTIAAST